ncbi:MAG: NAD-dependent epimerase/dehydratase family protein [Firmicutes bacterium]|jgi:UDP-glucose 4-epimerase|nr:NAD-dependent epimerase/dehydratase family protein [Bacillota bacterium]HPU01838.1 NAD-dependent epimerase/dehydratase family protein [Bacillota bacterium]
MKCLVTGAAGFIGFHLCKALLSRGAEVWGLDDFSSGKEERFRELGRYRSFHGIRGPFASVDGLAEIIAQTELIYHLAAVVGVKRYVEDPVRVIETNVCQTAVLLRLAQLHRRKVVFVSTSEVYGKSSSLPFGENTDCLYGSPLTSRWCYAISKSAAEHLCLGHAARGLPVVILRYFNVYGPHGEGSLYGGVANRFIEQALQGKPLTVYGDGRQTRCFTYVDDIVAGTMAAGESPAAVGRIINLGSDREISILDLARLVIRFSGSKAGLVFVPYEEVYGFSYEDIPRRVPDISTARRLLNFQPAVSLEEGMRRTLEWHRRKRETEWQEKGRDE